MKKDSRRSKGAEDVSMKSTSMLKGNFTQQQL
jgi:hypothetical protein